MPHGMASTSDCAGQTNSKDSRREEGHEHTKKEKEQNIQVAHNPL